MTLAHHRAAAMARFMKSDDHATMTKLVAEIDRIAGLVSELADDRGWRKMLAEAYGPETSRGIRDDWSAGGYNLQTIVGILGSMVIYSPETVRDNHP
jgi:hypothetical protein